MNWQLLEKQKGNRKLRRCTRIVEVKELMQ